MSAPLEIAPSVYSIRADFDGVPLTVYALMGDRPALIDAGVVTTPDEHLSPALASLGSGLADVGWIVNTHAHHDHVGGNAAVRAASPDVRIAVHAADAEWAQSAERYFAGLYRPWEPGPDFERRVLRLFGPGAAVDVRLTDGDEIDLGRDRPLRVRWTPAHSPGHVVLHDGDIVFAGDAIQRYGTEIEGRGWLFPFYTDVDAYRASLKAIAAAGTACTAHFGPVTGADLDRLVADSEELVATLDALIVRLLRERGAITLPEIADVLLDRWPHYQRGVQLYATPRAHLDALVKAGRARAVEQRWEAL